MWARCLGVPISVFAFATACSHSGSPSTPKPFSIPTMVTFKIPPSQPLSAAEVQQFQSFVNLQDGITRFAPQDLAFSNTGTGQLPPDQADVLNQITTNCLIGNFPSHGNRNGGKTISQTDMQTIGGAKCLLTYTRKIADVMQIEALDRRARSFSADGTISNDESLTMHPENATSSNWTDMYLQSSTDHSTVYYALQAPGDRVYYHYNDQQVLIGNPASNGYSKISDADILITNPTNSGGSAGLEIALNLSFNVPGMTKTVVISIYMKSDGNPNDTPLVEPYLNGRPVGVDPSASNQFVENQLEAALDSLQDLQSVGRTDAIKVNDLMNLVKSAKASLHTK